MMGFVVAGVCVYWRNIINGGVVIND